MAARKTPKTSAVDAAKDLLIEVTGRKIKLPRGSVLMRRVNKQAIPTKDGLVECELFYAKKADVPNVLASQWGFPVEEPELDCTVRELIQLDLGEVPTFN